MVRVWKNRKGCGHAQPMDRLPKGRKTAGPLREMGTIFSPQKRLCLYLRPQGAAAHAAADKTTSNMLLQQRKVKSDHRILWKCREPFHLSSVLKYPRRRPTSLPPVLCRMVGCLRRGYLETKDLPVFRLRNGWRNWAIPRHGAYKTALWVSLQTRRHRAALQPA
jgi:hypothetical protein